MINEEDFTIDIFVRVLGRFERSIWSLNYFNVGLNDEKMH